MFIYGRNLEPDILECEVKWALGGITTNKASGGDGIPVELFQILKDDAVKALLLNMPANLGNSAVATGHQHRNRKLESLNIDIGKNTLPNPIFINILNTGNKEN